MASLRKVIDVEDNPDLSHLVAEVRDTRDEMVVRLDGEEVAIILPIRRHRLDEEWPAVTEADKEAASSAAGSWEGHLDVDSFLEEIYARRDRWTRPSVEL